VTGHSRGRRGLGETLGLTGVDAMSDEAIASTNFASEMVDRFFTRAHVKMIAGKYMEGVYLPRLVLSDGRLFEVHVTEIIPDKK